jgi:hypothetical protein
MMMMTTISLICKSSYQCFDLAGRVLSFYRTEDLKEIILTAYRAVLTLIPKLKKFLPFQDNADTELLYNVVAAVRIAHTPHSALIYVVQMQRGCSVARSEAIRRIKQSKFDYLAAGQKPVKIDSQIRDKSLHGLNHPEIGRLLIPAEYLLDGMRTPMRTPISPCNHLLITFSA